jgi:membrane protease YdiL (CAAX protease family)
MPPEPNDPALNIFAVGTLLLSIAACMNVLHMRRKGPVLPYEPRRPVPWGAVGCVLVVLYLLNVAYAALQEGAAGEAADSSQPLAPSTLVFGMMQQLLFVAGILVVIALFTKATLRDLGWPANMRQFVRDVSVGGAACLAALAPVHIAQAALMFALFPDTKSGHPLIKMVMDAPPDPWILLLSGVAAVVVAPISEEIAFRLLFQGWLERREDDRLGWRKSAAGEMQNEPAAIAGDEATDTNDESNQPAASSPDVINSPMESEPPRRGTAGLPYGWFPIVISSIAFGVTHFGYGPEPVPIFLLGLVLGYIYQRTHRIIPGIVAHALFNLFTMIVLWRMVYHQG